MFPRPGGQDVAQENRSWAARVAAAAEGARRFETMVADALDALPDALRSQMDNVEVVIDDGPAPANLLGLYHGVPLTERQGYAGMLPDVITIYRRALEARARSIEDLEAEVRETVWHEVAHHFGISDERLHELGHD
jgi:predicted Zn-dependent protease with MMP-like domain